MKVLDSDHCIAILRGRLDLRGKLASDEVLAVTAIGVGELVHGVHKSARAADNLADLDVLLSQLVVLPYDERSARRFGVLKADLERIGTVVGDFDLQIASVVLQHNGLLLTHTQRHFSRIPGLVLEDWIA
jgi:tRNA(fMet)-specific endonuclease VapC